ncbi:hypothetical protein ACXR6G_18435 [Ancylomarina sp. YFZ004]
MEKINDIISQCIEENSSIFEPEGVYRPKDGILQNLDDSQNDFIDHIANSHKLEREEYVHLLFSHKEEDTGYDDRYNYFTTIITNKRASMSKDIYYQDIQHFENDSQRSHNWVNSEISFNEEESHIMFQPLNNNKYRYYGDFYFNNIEQEQISTLLEKINSEIRSIIFEKYIIGIKDRVEKKEYQEALDLCIGFAEKYGECTAFTMDAINLLIKLKRYEKARLIIEKELDENVSADYLYELLDSKTYLHYEQKDYYQALREALSVNNFKQNNDQERAGELITESYNDYRDKFITIPYNQRKLICIDENLSDLSSDKFLVVKKNDLPDISLPMGHPIENTLYIGHPYSAETYMPIENYEFELLLDKINEYSYILQCMGATKLSIENITGQNSDSQRKSSLDVEANVGSRLVNVNANVGIDKKSKIAQTFNQRIARNQTFSPTKKPYLPENLVWYPQTAAWKRLFEQRINGNILEHHDVISTQQTKLISQNELLSIKADFKSLLANIEASVNYETESIFEENETSDWKISVEFAPIETLKELAATINNAPELNRSNQEQSKLGIYSEEIKFMLEDDGQIDEDERRILERKRKKLGLSEEEALSVEQSLLADASYSEQELEFIQEIKDSSENGQLEEGDWRVLLRLAKKMGISEERARELGDVGLSNKTTSYNETELTYIEEIKFCLEDDGEISASERRLLNKERDSLGISAERAEEIEQEFIKEVEKR